MNRRLFACCAILLIACDTEPGPTDGAVTDAPPGDASARDGGAVDATARDDAGADAAIECDRDGDGRRATACGGDDCDDLDSNRFPGNAEICDAADHDEDCDPVTYGVRDTDGDGFVDAACCNDGPDGMRCGDDCNDMRAGTHPTAPEVCNTLDDDCDLGVDEGVLQRFYLDADADLHGADGDPGMELCAATGLYRAVVSGDCNDANPVVYDGAFEICDLIDNDCDTDVDEDAVPVPWYADADRDGFGDAAVAAITSCTPVALRVLNDADCDDSSPAISPVGIEVCNLRDDDCDDQTDEGVALMLYVDADGDGHGNPASTPIASCSIVVGRSVLSDDCDDARATAYFGALELCNALDDDCDVAADEQPDTDLACSVARVGGAAICRGGGGCTPTLCDAGRADCDGNVPNGCEVASATDAANCGGCGLACPTGIACEGGVCRQGTVVEITAGEYHACARLDSGRVLCWGMGPLGRAGTPMSPIPVAVTGLDDAIHVATRQAHTCAVRSGGTIACWGTNGGGQLGDVTTLPSETPVAVESISDASHVATGHSFTCAIRAGGQVWCWGGNESGTLGDSSTTPSLRPVRAGTLTGVVELAAGSLHVCARLSDGTVACWGSNSGGELGIGTMGGSRSTPGAVPGLTGVVELRAGDSHTCARRATGDVVCWGANAGGQSTGTPGANALTPTAVIGTSDAIGLGVGKVSCIVRAAGTSACWGARGTAGELGDGETGGTSGPTTVVEFVPTGGGMRPPDFRQATMIRVGAGFGCALTTLGRVRCWGDAAFGRLGDELAANSAAPTQVRLVADPIDIAAGAGHTCIRRLGGDVLCWGENARGQASPSTTGTNVLAPVIVPGVSDVAALALGDAHSCAVRFDGTLVCWGANTAGQLGAPGGPAPVVGAGISDAIGVAAFDRATCTRSLAGTVACFGEVAPVERLGMDLTGALGLVASETSACVVLGDGAAECSGDAPRGDGSPDGGPERLRVLGIDDALGPALGADFGCVLRTGGRVACWGANDFGQLGDGTRASHFLAGNVSALSNARGVVAGGGHACALRTGGAIACWGRNADGELGDVSTTDRLIPTAVATGIFSARALAAGAAHTCAVLTDQRGVRCWGAGAQGELGRGTTGASNAPVAAEGL